MKMNRECVGLIRKLHKAGK